MKILIATNHSYMLWQFRRELIQSLAREHEVVISTPLVGHHLELEALGCKVVETKLDRRSVNPAKDMALLNFYRRLLRKERPQLVVTYSIKPNVYMGLACRMAKIPYCSNVQGLGTAFQTKVLAKIAKAMYQAGLKKAKTVFFENSANMQLFEEMGIVHKDRVCLLPGAGVNLGFHTPWEYPLDEPVRFLYLGRIMKEKGIGELFDAMEQLHEKYGGRVILDLVGFFEDEYRDRVEDLTARGIVKFYGFQENPRSYYSLSHCVVLPSYHEGMSNVLLEAAAAARPLITSDIPGCREAVDDGYTGLLCKAKDVQSLFEAMDLFVQLPPEARQAMGARGREKMAREFDREQVVSVVTEQLVRAAHG